KAYDFRTLVAFSGTLVDEEFDAEQELSEAQMNGGIAEKGLPVEFAKDLYRILIVAEKNTRRSWTSRCCTRCT
ncbi:MAG TPA: hypothetical protein VH640_28680, partial [Bryobacteraceae bacterium]